MGACQGKLRESSFDHITFTSCSSWSRTVKSQPSSSGLELTSPGFPSTASFEATTVPVRGLYTWPHTLISWTMIRVIRRHDLTRKKTQRQRLRQIHLRQPQYPSEGYTPGCHTLLSNEPFNEVQSGLFLIQELVSTSLAALTDSTAPTSSPFAT